MYDCMDDSFNIRCNSPKIDKKLLALHEQNNYKLKQTSQFIIESFITVYYGTKFASHSVLKIRDWYSQILEEKFPFLVWRKQKKNNNLEFVQNIGFPELIFQEPSIWN